jgi:hypothetical protein
MEMLFRCCMITLPYLTFDLSVQLSALSLKVLGTCDYMHVPRQTHLRKKTTGVWLFHHFPWQSDQRINSRDLAPAASVKMCAFECLALSVKKTIDGKTMDVWFVRRPTQRRSDVD